MATAASSTVEMRRRHKSSSSMGSKVRVIAGSAPLQWRSWDASAKEDAPRSGALPAKIPSHDLRQNRTVGEQPRRGAGADDEGALVLLEHGRTLDAHAG